ncbi:unnamed protein product [Miscanthus lutarioriparius]|uniref:Uncharacterized protein n=1 Tax=Miscanthus lutarioriparius TaxID=422564 RepID=A0A811QBC0_9POAL|nr:unnamed protein product [Miscanthus lutarioriparius]
MELGLSLGEAPVPDTTGRALPELGLGLVVGIGASATGIGRGGEEGGRGTSRAAGMGTGWWAAASATLEPAVRLSLMSSSLGLQWPPSDVGICHAGHGEAPAACGFDMNRALSSVVASALAALEDDKEDPGAAAALSSLPNDNSTGSFPLDPGGGIHAHAEGGGVA